MCSPGAFGCVGYPLVDWSAALRGIYDLGLVRQLGTTWNTVGPISTRVCKPHLMTPPASQACGHPGSMGGVWHHQDAAAGAHVNSPASWTTRGKDHPTAHSLDLVPGRSGTVRENWLAERGKDLRAGVRIATLDPFQGNKNAIDDQLQDTTSVLVAFHIVMLAGDAPGEVRRCVHQDTTGHR